MDKREKKESDSERTQEKEWREQEEELDDELKQTFPASDPPSHTRPGDDEED